MATPLVTRYLIATTWIASILNPILGLDDLVCASPYDIIRKGQLWRLALSIIYVPGLINALIMSFVLYRLAAAWEQERGSIRILYYFILAVVATNLGVCVLAVVVAPVAPSVLSPAFLCGPGILSAFLVLITRSSQGYSGSSVSILGLFTMPTLYFPLLLLVFFAAFGANPLARRKSHYIFTVHALVCSSALVCSVRRGRCVFGSLARARSSEEARNFSTLYGVVYSTEYTWWCTSQSYGARPLVMVRGCRLKQEAREFTMGRRRRRCVITAAV